MIGERVGHAEQSFECNTGEKNRKLL